MFDYTSSPDHVLPMRDSGFVRFSADEQDQKNPVPRTPVTSNGTYAKPGRKNLANRKNGRGTRRWNR